MEVWTNKLQIKNLFKPNMEQVRSETYHVRVKNKQQALLVNGEFFYSWVDIASLKLELHFQPYYMEDKNILKLC